MTGILIIGFFEPLQNWVDEFIPYEKWKEWDFRPQQTMILQFNKN